MAKTPIKQLSDLAKSVQKQRVSLAAWIEANVQLPQGISAEPGPIKLAPYMRQLADSMVDPAVERVSVLKAARVGYTTVLAGLIGYHMTTDPAPCLVVVPAERDARNFVVDLEQIFETSESLVGKLPTPATAGRSSRNTLLYRKGEDGATLRLVGANAPRNLRAVTARILLCDETDALVTTKAEGNPLQLAANRTLSFANRKLITGSTPLALSTSHVCRLFEESDQRVYEVRCPHCRDYAELQWEQISWPEGKPEQAVWNCPECGADVEEKQKARAVKEGRWRALKPEVKGHHGYRLSALISSLPNATWAKLAAEFDAVKQDPDRLRVFYNTVLARPWDDNVADINTNALMEKAEDFSLDAIPEEILALTLGGDCQDDRIEAVVAGWSRDGVCHIMHHEVFYASERTIVDDNDAWKQLDAFLRRRYDHPLGGQLKIDACCIDASDGDHMATVMQFCRARAGRRVMATKGLSGFSRPPLAASQNKTKFGRLWLVGSDSIKSRIYDQLSKGRMFRFSNTLTETFYEQLCSENVVIRRVGGRPVKGFERIKGLDAECLDATVYAIAAKTALHLNDAWFDQRVDEMRDAVAFGTKNPEQEQPRFAKSDWFGAPRGGLRDANGG